METLSVSASALKYASGSSWTSGKARQGVYDRTRYAGGMRFAGLADLPSSNIAISEIRLKLTFNNSGASTTTKELHLWTATQDTISGDIMDMLNDEIGIIDVERAYNRTVTLTFNTTTNSDVFTPLRSYIADGNQTLMIYVESTRGSHGSFCYDYLGITAATIAVDYDENQISCTLTPKEVVAGNPLTLTINDNDPTHKHTIHWGLKTKGWVTRDSTGQSHSQSTEKDWINEIPSDASGQGYVKVETKNNMNSIISTVDLTYTITVPTDVVPTIGNMTLTHVNGNTWVNEQNIYVVGKSKVTATVSGCAGAYGSTIKSCSITSSPNIGSRTWNSVSTGYTFTTDYIQSTGIVSLTTVITDTRGRTAKKTQSIYVYPYSPPSIDSLTVYRCNSDFARNDTSGQYAYLKAVFACDPINGQNKATAVATLTSEKSVVVGRYSIPKSGAGYKLNSNTKLLALDMAYTIDQSVTDSLGTKSTISGTLASAAYLLHFSNTGKAIGIGSAAGADETITMGWTVKMNKPLEISQGGTGASTAAEACQKLGVLSTTGKAASASTADTATKALSADKLTNARWININGYLYAGTTFDGSNNIVLDSYKQWTNYERIHQKIATFGEIAAGRTDEPVYLGITYSKIISIGGVALADNYYYPIPRITENLTNGRITVRINGMYAYITTGAKISITSGHLIIEYIE